MKDTVYYVSKEEDKINALGENGWEIIEQQGILICHEFEMHEDAPILEQFVQWFEKRANADKKERDTIKKSGFEVRQIYDDNVGKKRYKLTEKGLANIRKWRLEFSFVEEKPVAYITFGPVYLNTPAFISKDVIDRYVPKEIIEQAISCGALTVGEYEEA